MALSPRERNLLIGLLLVAVAASTFFLLTREGDEPPEAAPPTVSSPFPPTPSPIGPTPSPTAQPPPRRPLPPLAIVTGRDPFVPLVVAEVVDGASPPSGGEEPQPPVEAPGPGAERREQPGVTVGGRQVSLVDVFSRGGEQAARIEVDGRTFTAAEGERFAGNFRVVAIDGDCATLLFGDETFRVCIPEQGK